MTVSMHAWLPSKHRRYRVRAVREHMNRFSICLATALLSATLFAVGAGATDFYVSPNGSANGNGSINSPWDLQTALLQPAAVRPGDVIWMRGGTYAGNYYSGLNGS